MHLSQSSLDLQMVQLRHIPKRISVQSAESITPEISENTHQTNDDLLSKYLFVLRLNIIHFFKKKSRLLNVLLYKKSQFKKQNNYFMRFIYIFNIFNIK